jgi:flagellar biosynthesis/type III secretory pathway protein FliH
LSDRNTTVDAGPRAYDRFALFAEDFDLSRADRDIPDPEVIQPGFSAADIAAARAEAWAEGFESGAAEAQKRATNEIGALLDRIAGSLRDMREDAAAIVEQGADAIARTLMDSLGAVLPALCAQYGEAELRVLVQTILPALAREPSVTMRLNPAHIPALMRELDRLEPELIERVHLLPVEAIPLGDVRLSWEDGVATRDAADLWRQVQAVLVPAGLLTPVAMAREKELQHAG